MSMTDGLSSLSPPGQTHLKRSSIEAFQSFQWFQPFQSVTPMLSPKRLEQLERLEHLELSRREAVRVALDLFRRMT